MSTRRPSSRPARRPAFRPGFEDLLAEMGRRAGRCGGNLPLDPLAAVDGFKALDPPNRSSSRCGRAAGLVCVGVRDDEDGAFESGWVLVQSGVGYERPRRPRPLDATRRSQRWWTSRLGKDQGNPAHLYLYDGRFFLANDTLNGYTRIDPAKYRRRGEDGPQGCAAVPRRRRQPYHAGGGRGQGRLLVLDRRRRAEQRSCRCHPVTQSAKTEPAYSFHLPTGASTGPPPTPDKVFFAPADGVCWVEADIGLKLKADRSSPPHRLSEGRRQAAPHRGVRNHGHLRPFRHRERSPEPRPAEREGRGAEAGVRPALAVKEGPRPSPLTSSRRRTGRRMRLCSTTARRTPTPRTCWRSSPSTRTATATARTPGR